MNLRVPALVLSLFSCACVEKEAPCVLGSPSDVTTEPGVYDGYEILEGCQIESVPFAVRGTGAMWFEGAAPGSDGRFDAVSDLVGIVWEANRATESVGGIGFGTPCRPESGISVSVKLSDWRDVDEVFARTGALLAERDLREEVGVSVAVAVPH